MTIGEIMAEDLAATAFDTDAPECPAEAATYTAPGGEPVAVTLVAGEVRDADEESPDGRATYKTASAYVQKTENALAAFE